jgi:hypothetical protein
MDHNAMDHNAMQQTAPQPQPQDDLRRRENSNSFEPELAPGVLVNLIRVLFRRPFEAESNQLFIRVASVVDKSVLVGVGQLN